MLGVARRGAEAWRRQVRRGRRRRLVPAPGQAVERPQQVGPERGREQLRQVVDVLVDEHAPDHREAAVLGALEALEVDHLHARADPARGDHERIGPQHATDRNRAHPAGALVAAHRLLDASRRLVGRLDRVADHDHVLDGQRQRLQRRDIARDRRLEAVAPVGPEHPRTGVARHEDRLDPRPRRQPPRDGAVVPPAGPAAPRPERRGDAQHERAARARHACAAPPLRPREHVHRRPPVGRVAVADDRDARRTLGRRDTEPADADRPCTVERVTRRVGLQQRGDRARRHRLQQLRVEARVLEIARGRAEAARRRTRRRGGGEGDQQGDGSEEEHLGGGAGNVHRNEQHHACSAGRSTSIICPSNGVAEPR